MCRILFLCCLSISVIQVSLSPAQQSSVVTTAVPSEVVAADGSVPVEHPAAASGSVVYSEAPVTGTIQPVSYQAAVANDALSVVNQKRRQAGLYPFQFDPVLSSVAQQKSMTRASRRITGHDGLPKGGAAVEGVGNAYGYHNLLGRFHTCYLYSRGYRSAGAAVAFDGSGRAYYTLLLR